MAITIASGTRSVAICRKVFTAGGRGPKGSSLRSERIGERSAFRSGRPVLSEILGKMHQAPHLAGELAVYTALLADHLEEPYVRELLQGRFHALAELLTLFFTPDQLRNVFATGSAAYGFRELLAECLLDGGMTLSSVERDPLPGLVRHHQLQAP